MLYMEHICQIWIKNVIEAKVQKTTGIKGKLSKKQYKKEAKKQSQMNWLPLGMSPGSP